MADFAEDATVQVRLTRPIAGPGHEWPELGVLLTREPQELSGETANTLKESLPHTIVGEDDVEFEVVEEGSSVVPEEVGFASPAAEELADEAGLGPEDLGDPSGKTGYTKADVQSAIDSQEASSEESEAA